MPAPDRYAVIGHPIAHSRSPQIHRLFAQQCQQYMVYTAADVPPDRLTGWVAKFFNGTGFPGRGLNVTIPHKQSLLTMPSRLSPRARIAGAINTLFIDPQGQLCGDNTDGIGLVRDLTENLQVTITAHRVLLLGAGGAARGVLAPLLELKPAQLVIANRTPGRALELAHNFSAFGAVHGCSYEGLRDAKFDLVINATAASLHGELPSLSASAIAGPETLCYDMAYGDEDTRFVHWAREHGARGVMGLGMLIEQAAESFYLWRGLRPNTAAVRAVLGARA
jgi:shikimate dehydrogenase